MDIPELSKALCEEQTAVVQRFLDGVEKALSSYGWVTDIVGPSYISPAFVEIVACYHGYPFALTFSNSGNTIHARGRTVPEMEASARSIKNLTTKVIKELASAPYLSTEATTLLVQWREARVVADRSSENRAIFAKLCRAAAAALDRLHNGRLEQLKLAANNFARTPNRATEHALADEVNTLLKR
jgi:hypothetical protein